MENPYQPGAGSPPPFLAGRDEALDRIDFALQRRAMGFLEQGVVAYGLRGVGKTVLIDSALKQHADADRWVVIRVEVPQSDDFGPALAVSMRDQIGEDLTRDRKARSLLSVFKSFSLSVGATGVAVGVEAEPSKAKGAAGSLDIDLPDLLHALGEYAKVRKGLAVVAIDEMHVLDDRALRAIVTAAQVANRDELPLTFLGAGLPGLPAALQKAKTYADRAFEYIAIGRLDDAASREALVRPADELGVRWELAAVAMVAERAGGYPYFIQHFGSYVWDEAAVLGSDVVTESIAHTGMRRAIPALDRGFFQGRWSALPDSARDYLRAMTEVGDGDVAATGDIARHLGKEHRDLSFVRDRLIGDSVLYSPRRGLVAFAVPGFDGFIRRRVARIEEIPPPGYRPGAGDG